MSRPLPIWQELPVHFKKDVVGYLDFLSRLDLRSCSKSEKSLVDSCPLHISDLEFEQYDDRFPTYLSVIFVENETKYKFESEENFATALFNLLSHRKSECSYLHFNWEPEVSYDKVIKEFLDKLENREQELNIRNLFLFAGKSTVLIPLFKYLKPDALNEIDLNLKDFEEETKKSTVRELVETDQFKYARRILLYDYSVDDYFQKFFGFNRFKIRVENLTEKMLLELMDAVKTRSPPIGSHFVINSSKVIEVDTLEPAFQDFEGVLNRLKEDQTPQKAVHLISDSTCLVIIKWSNTIEATVCGRKNWQNDFQKRHGKNVHLVFL